MRKTDQDKATLICMKQITVYKPSQSSFFINPPSVVAEEASVWS